MMIDAAGSMVHTGRHIAKKCLTKLFLAFFKKNFKIIDTYMNNMLPFYH